MNYARKNSEKKSRIVYVFLFILILIPAFPNGLSGQVAVPGTPESFSFGNKKNIKLPEKLLSTLNIEDELKYDREKGISNRYGIVEELNINLRDNSFCTEIPGKGFIWQYKIKAEKAIGVGILFTSYHVPDGASIFVYTPDQSQILGAFTSLNNNPLSILSIADVKGDQVIIEYFEPYLAEFPGNIVLGSVSLAYRDFFDSQASTRININCSQGNDWQNEKHAVARITFRDVGGSYYCTGFLVNNARQDLTPYFITADHCINTSYSASTLVAYFNYENSECHTEDALTNQTVSGASLVSNSDYTDFSLLLLNSTPPGEYKAYLAGWDASGRIAQSGVGIHHPAGTPKCISTENNPFILYGGNIEWTDGTVTEPKTHWIIEFNSGDTEEGSSGSPLFDENRRVTGQLHGGDEKNSIYGAFHLSWNHESEISKQLKHWLDPDNTGILQLNGKYLNATPLAGFSVTSEKVCLDNTIRISDNSRYEPGEWKWEISPNEFKYMNGTSDTDQNPEVKFTKTGLYSIKLIARNKWGSDSLVKTDYLNVVSEISVGFVELPAENLVCGCDLVDFHFIASGGEDYLFSFSRPDKAGLVASGNTAILTLKDDQKKFGTFNSVLRVEGSIGTCKASDSIRLKVVIPPNDNIEDAFLIFPGKNGPYSNNCATGQLKEAYPGPFHCFSQTTWCPGTTSDGIQNSIWFSFIGPSNGKITIDTKGINSRISVFEADSAQQIISGRPTTYFIIGANDDRSPIDNTSLLENLDVSPGKKYWLQVESFDADTGFISISLLTQGLELFPNPSTGRFVLFISESSEAIARIFIYNASGNLIVSDEATITSDSNRLSYDLSQSPSGMYFIRVLIAGSEFSKKILLVH